jgi:hypothetical protein
MTKINLEQADARILEFLTMLLEKKGVGTLPDEIVADMLLDLFTRFQNLFLLSITKTLSPEALIEFDKIISVGLESESVQNFLKTHIPDLEGLLTKTMNEFAETYLNS